MLSKLGAAERFFTLLPFSFEASILTSLCETCCNTFIAEVGALLTSNPGGEVSELATSLNLVSWPLGSDTYSKVSTRQICSPRICCSQCAPSPINASLLSITSKSTTLTGGSKFPLLGGRELLLKLTLLLNGGATESGQTTRGFCSTLALVSQVTFCFTEWRSTFKLGAISDLKAADFLLKSCVFGSKSQFTRLAGGEAADLGLGKVGTVEVGVKGTLAEH